MLELGEHLLDGVEGWGIGRPEGKFAADLFDGFVHGL